MSTCVDVDSQPIAVVLTAGDTFKVRVELTDASGQPVPVTGWQWDVPLLNAEQAMILPVVVTETDAPGGIFELGITDDNSATLTPGDYTWPVRATDTASDTLTLFTGQLRVKAVGVL